MQRSRNRWGRHVSVGDVVSAHHPRGGTITGTVAKIAPEESRGLVATLDNGHSVSIHDIFESQPKTWLAPEEHAYPAGGQTRKGAAIYPDGKVRRVWAGIPDTFFTIPAHGRMAGRYVSGFLTTNDAGAFVFNVHNKERAT